MLVLKLLILIVLFYCMNNQNFIGKIINTQNSRSLVIAQNDKFLTVRKLSVSLSSGLKPARKHPIYLGVFVAEHQENKVYSETDFERFVVNSTSQGDYVRLMKSYGISHGFNMEGDCYDYEVEMNSMKLIELKNDLVFTITSINKLN